MSKGRIVVRFVFVSLFLTPMTSAQTTSSSSPPSLAGKLEVEDGSGKLVFSIKPEKDGAKLVDASEKEIARYNIKGDALKIKDASDQVLGYIEGPPGRYRVTDPTRKITRFKLQREPDGDWKLKGADEALLAKIKERDYGFEVEDGHERSLAKIKAKDGKMVVRDTADQPRYTVHGTALRPMSVACLALDPVGELPLRAGLLVRVAIDPSPTAPKEAPQR